jgi:hypothetical protein
MLKSRTILSIDLGEKSLSGAEILSGNSIPIIKQSFQWNYPEGISIGEELGKLFRQFLRSHRITATRIAIGIPASWVLSRQKTLPPAEHASLVGLLSIEAERDFSFSRHEIVLDYCELPSKPQEPKELLLCAIPSKKLDQIQKMASAAGLKILSVAPSITALSSFEKESSDTIVLRAGQEGIEIMKTEEGIPREIHRLAPIPTERDEDPDSPSLKDWIKKVVEETTRYLLLSPSTKKREDTAVLFWNDISLSTPLLDSLLSALPLTIKKRNIFDLLPSTHAKDSFEPLSSSAVLLAFSSIYPRTPALNFLRPRLLLKKEWKVTPVTQRLLLAATALILLITAGIIDQQSQKKSVALLRAQTEQFSPSLKETKEILANIRALRLWKPAEPLFLECIRGLTLAFPAEGSIWTTTLSLREDMKGVLSGKANDDMEVLNLIESLKKNPDFSQITLVHMRESGRETGEINWMISFQFIRGSSPQKEHNEA